MSGTCVPPPGFDSLILQVLVAGGPEFVIRAADNANENEIGDREMNVKPPKIGAGARLPQIRQCEDVGGGFGQID
jgi:hypothetical protein